MTAYLTMLFDDLLNGSWIELRAIRGRGSVQQRGYESLADLEAAIPEAIEACRDGAAGLYVGVCPRARQDGKRDSVEHGRVCWVDLDYKDFAGGEAEARGMINSIAPRPTCIVHSGHGVHLYWALDEWTPADAIEARNRALANVIGGDHCWNADRILRLVDSWNVKDAKKPVQCRIIEHDTARVYAIGDLANVSAKTPAHKPRGANDANATGLTPFAQRLLDTNQHVAAHFAGRGKAAGTDSTGSGYDYTVAVDVIKRGGTDADAASMVRARLAAREVHKPNAYVTRTVEAARAACGEQAAGSLEMDFRVEAFELLQDADTVWVRIWISDARHTQDGGTAITLPITQFVSLQTFRVAYTAQLLRVPTIKAKKGLKDLWVAWCNAHLDGATPRPMGDEATDLGRFRTLVDRKLSAMAEGETVEHFASGATILIDGSRYVSANAIVNYLRAERARYTSAWLHDHLTELGYTRKRIMIPDRGGDLRTVDAWGQPIAQ